MALFGSILSGLKGLGGFLGQVGGLVGAIRNVSAPSPIAFLPAVGPVPQIAPLAASIVPAPVQVAARMPMPSLGGGSLRALPLRAASAITGALAPVLIKIAEITGSTTMTLRRAVKIVRRMGKVLVPASVAVALGLTIEELGTLILADSQRVRRRMNPANVSALRRSMRRIQSFHRLCQKADLLRGPGRSRRKTSRSALGDGTKIVQVK